MTRPIRVCTVVESDGVKAQMRKAPAPFAAPPQQRRADDPPALVPVDAFQRAAMAGAAASADFDDDCGLPVDTDEVDFARAAVDIGSHHTQTFLLQPRGGTMLPLCAGFTAAVGNRFWS